MNSELAIGGRAVPIECLRFHFQHSAFPGGFRYEIELNEPWLASELAQLFPAGVRDANREETEKVLGFLQSVISFRHKKRPDLPVAYFANALSNLRIDGETVFCDGTCSATSGANSLP